MSSPQDTQKLLRELAAFLNEYNADPDDAAPAMLVLGARIAYANGKSLDTVMAVVRSAYEEAKHSTKPPRTN